MADMIQNALRRKLAAAQEVGDVERIGVLRRMLGSTEAPAEVPPEPAPEPEIQWGWREPEVTGADEADAVDGDK